MDFHFLTLLLCLFVLPNRIAASNVGMSGRGHDDDDRFHANFEKFSDISTLWYTCPSSGDHQPALFYRYGQPYVLQSYSAMNNLHFNRAEKTLDISSQPNFIEKSWTGGAISSRGQFKFLYGDYEWIARIAPSLNVLSIFRLTEDNCHWDAQTLAAIKIERLQGPAVQLAVEWMGAGNATSLTATVFYPSAYIRVDHPSPDWSDSPHSGWISSMRSCKICQNDLSQAYYSYKLRWTDKELTWSINDTVAFHLQDVRKIPQSALLLSISLVRGENITEMTPGNLSIQSVVVRDTQASNVTNSVPYVQLTETVIGNFSNSFDSRWRVWEGLASDSESVGGVNPVYDSLCVREKNGHLQLLVGQTTTSANERYYNTARIDGTASFLYGDIEWRVLVLNTTIGAAYLLRLVQNPCIEAASVIQRYSTFQCRSSVGPSINFYFEGLAVAGVYEHFNSEKTLVSYTSNLYYQFRLQDGPGSLQDVHRFRIRWRNSSITWFVDDDEIGNVADPSILPSRAMFISMQTRVKFQEQPWPTAVMGNSTFLVPSMEIQYLKYTPDPKNSPSPTTTSTIITASGTSRSTTIATAIAVALVVAVILGGCALCCRRLRAPRQATENTNTRVLLRTMPSSERHTYARYMQFMQVSRNDVDISSEVLGRGEFSVVLKGSARSLPTVLKGPTEVAVKTLSDNNDQTKFYEEFLIMTKAGRHINVISLLGVVLDVDRQCLLLEFCRYGSLRSYLCSYGSENTIHHVDSHGNLLPCISIDRKDGKPDRNTVTILCTDELMKFGHQISRGMEHLTSRATANTNHQVDRLRCACIARKDAVKSDQQAEILETTLCTNDLLKFSHQISRGMEYLTSRAIIHRDLAARNVLVCANGILKISDFGLAKHGQQEYMVSNMSAALPVLWMPPEAILTGTFSHKSDVWSFGVVLWEIFSLGQPPFNTADVTKFSAGSFAAWLLAGHQMEMPPGTPTDIRKIMLNCWTIEPDERRNFSALVPILNDIISMQSISDDLTYIPLLDGENEFNSAYAEQLEVIAKLQIRA